MRCSQGNLHAQIVGCKCVEAMGLIARDADRSMQRRLRCEHWRARRLLACNQNVHAGQAIFKQTNFQFICAIVQHHTIRQWLDLCRMRSRAAVC